jgi:alkaline phosphatase
MSRLPTGLALGLLAIFITTPAMAATIYPIDRARILAGERFDFRVDFRDVVAPGAYSVTIDGKPYAAVLGREGRFSASEPDNKDEAKAKNFSSITVPDVVLKMPGTHEVQVSTPDGDTAKVSWTVYATGRPKAKNVILFIGDGMTIANRTAARILSKGIVQGKYLGHLSFDDFPYTALIGTSSVDSIATDSANSMSAYTTGHKSSVNALGVYASRSVDPLNHPKVETIGELVKRLTRKSVGVVTDAEVEDATPAGVFAHTRLRGEYLTIVDQFLASGVDVLMGGGSVAFKPKDAPLVLPLPEGDSNKRRSDDRDVVAEFRSRGYAFADTAGTLGQVAADPATRKLLGLFHENNLDGALDRHILKQGTVAQFPEQPDLTQMTRDALTVLSRNKNGFFLMVEAGLIDKFSHRLDGERSVYDTILLSNAVQVAVDWSKAHGDDTLIIVTPDHTHPLSLVGDIDENLNDSVPGRDDAREKVGTYAKARFPTYPPADTDGYPENVLASRHLALVYGAHPDYYETYSPKTDGPFDPTECAKHDPADDKKCLEYGANSKYKSNPRAQLMPGNLPHSTAVGVHAVDDGVLSATGPGAAEFHGFMDNTEVFHVMVDALGLAPAPAVRTAKPSHGQ